MFTSTALILAFSIAGTGSTLPPNTVIRAIVEPAAAQTDAWDCIVRGWVRAPDLAPDMRTQADARLVLADGNGCGNIRRWDVGLRPFERSVCKFRLVVGGNDKQLWQTGAEMDPFMTVRLD